MKDLIKSQQSELDGVETYLKLAETVHNESDADTFRKLAADEGRHAAVLRHYTKKCSALKSFRLMLYRYYTVSLGRGFYIL